jgi:hypothetical protein
VSGGITERWSGGAWHLVAPARPGQWSELDGVAATATAVWSVGSFVPTTPGSGPIERTLAERTP